MSPGDGNKAASDVFQLIQAHQVFFSTHYHIQLWIDFYVDVDFRIY